MMQGVLTEKTLRDYGGLGGFVDAFRSSLRIDIGKFVTKHDLRIEMANLISNNSLDLAERHVLGALDIPLSVESTNCAEPSQFKGVFKHEYVGAVADILYEHVSVLNKSFAKNPAKYYSKQLSIVQSSGTGKSRALMELKNRDSIVLYVNLRSKYEPGNPYPERDDIPADILDDDLGCSKKQYSLRCSSFFAVFLVLKKYLYNIREQEKTRSGMVKAWSRSMCDIGSDARRQFFYDVHLEYNKINSPTIKSEIAIPCELSTGAQQSAFGGYNTPPTKQTARWNGNENSIWSTRQGIEIFDANSNAPCMIIELDEAHSLQIAQRDYLRSHVLSRSISFLSEAYPDVSPCVVIASTAFEIAEFAAPADLNPSGRVSIDGKTLFHPYHLLGFDQEAPRRDEVDRRR
ncbi:hypothetical protein RhiJN_25656 [Ceratobasidium sp. AG-Ba]|nr:hypothetical protein RhiJN_25656 [Ceratobasidium sp. AG-Ba]